MLLLTVGYPSVLLQSFCMHGLRVFRSATKPNKEAR